MGPVETHDRAILRRVLASAALACGLIAGPGARADDAMAFPGRDWEQATPESQGLNPARLAEAIAYLEAHSGPDGVEQLVVIRNGRLIWEGTDANQVHGVWSCTKSITSTTLGLLIDDGKCRLDSHASEFLPALAAPYPGVTLRHFASMTSGYRAIGDEPRGGYTHGPSPTPLRPDPEPLFAPPGSRYAYWDSAMNQFANVLTRIAGEPLEELFRRRVAGPIGMDPDAWDWGDYGLVDDLVVNGGAGNHDKHVQISARELARLGHLFLNRGRWGEQRILSESWVDAATSVQVPASLPLGHAESGIDGRGVYGLNWWVNGLGPGGERKWPGAPEGTFAASGYNNNDLFVIPEWQMVVVRLGLDQGTHEITDAEYGTFLGMVGRAIEETGGDGNASASPPTAGCGREGPEPVPGRPQGPPAQHPAGPALRVSADGRYLVTDRGTPFFWLGDTAWLLSQMTSRDDAELYLRTRAEQGFTVIQAAIIMGEERVGGTLRPNRYGDLAFQDGDPARPAVTDGDSPEDAAAYDYWDHVDYVVARARAHGLTLALLPLFVGYRGDGFKYLTPENAEAYGLFLGRRYREEPHVVWALGGDNTPDTEAKRAVWDRLAQGITTGVADEEDYGRTLMTYHINGQNSSSQWFHGAPWLDFNMIQVWGDEKAIYPKIIADRGLKPARPTGLGEGSYEDGPQYPTRPIDALKVRKQAYWSYLAGGYHTYGNTNTWNFGSYEPENTQDWKQALRSPGAGHLSVLAKLFAQLEWWRFVPDQSVIAAGAGDGEARNIAMRSADGGRILAYLAGPAEVALELGKLTGAEAALATWIDPRTGERTALGEFPTAGARPFAPPEGWPDALLLIEARR